MERDKLSILVVVTALLAVAMVGAALIAPTLAGNPDASANRTITVDATGDASTAPDQAVLRLEVTAEGDNASTVRDDLATGADALQSNLADANVSEGDYETSEYRIRRNHHREGGEPEYRGVHAFEVTLDDPERAGTVVDAAVDAGVEVGHVRFTLSDARRETIRDTAIQNALDDARVQADTIASSTDLQVTSVVTVDATRSGYRPVRWELMSADAASGGGSTQLETGDVSVQYEVTVTYRAVQK